MSGYQQLPNQGYGYQTGYPQPGYNQPAYQPGYQPQQPGYYQQQAPAPSAPSGPIVVNVVNSQQQQTQAPIYQPVRTTVFLGRNYESDIAPALIVFIIGWFCCCVWAAGFKFIRSPNGVAKLLGILSVICFFLSIGGLITVIVVTTAAANTLNNAGSTTTQTTTLTVFASSSYVTTITVPYWANYVTISYYSGQWQAPSQTGYTGWVTASGYFGSSCTNSGCPVYGNPIFELDVKCGSTGTYSKATYWTATYCSSGYLYFSPNVGSSNMGLGSGSVTVSITFNKYYS